jgi:DNA invertase Pin-like site-specific DNA recombinase
MTFLYVFYVFISIGGHWWDDVHWWDDADCRGDADCGSTKRVGLYLRVSTAGQTVENQRQDLQRVAEQRGWQIIGEYIDHGVSGAKRRDQRPAFDRMCTDAAKGHINMVAAWALDRLGRSVRDVINFLADLPEQGVALYLHREQLDTATPVGKLVLTIMAGVAEMERSLNVERINAGVARARKAGRIGGRPPVNSKVEKRIRALRAKGLGKLKIARQLHCGVSTVQRVLLAAQAA